MLLLEEEAKLPKAVVVVVVAEANATNGVDGLGWRFGSGGGGVEKVANFGAETEVGKAVYW